MYRELLVQEVPAGDFIIQQGQAFGPYIFLVIDGEAALMSTGPSGIHLCRWRDEFYKRSMRQITCVKRI